MEWVVVAIFASGVVTTDMRYDSVYECMDSAAVAASDAYRAVAWERGNDLILPKYSCVSVDD